MIWLREDEIGACAAGNPPHREPSTRRNLLWSLGHFESSTFGPVTTTEAFDARCRSWAQKKPVPPANLRRRAGVRACG